MGNSSYFWFDDDNKTKYIYSPNHHRRNGYVLQMTYNIRCVETQAIYCCNVLNFITMMNFHWKYWVQVACASYIHGKYKQIWYQWNICWHTQCYVVHTITAQKLPLKTLSLNDNTGAVCAKYILRSIISMNLLLAQIAPYCTHVWPLLSLCLPRNPLHKQLMNP